MRDQFKQLLFNNAVLKARSLGYTFSSITESDLKEFISQGVDNMNFAQMSSPTDNLRAVRNTELLIEKMAENARSRYLNESLDYKSFSNIRDSICPLWPFC